MAQKEAIESVLNCIDRALEVFGNDFKRIIYWQLSKTCGLTKKEIAENPEKLADFLQRTFGKGAKIIEREIVSHIALEFNLSTTNQFDIVEAIGCAVNQILIA